MCWRLQPVSSRLSSGSGRYGSSLEWLLLRCLGLDDTQQEGSELIYESLVLLLQHGHAVFKASDVLLLLSPTFPRSFPGSNSSNS
ncbi:hypothetical protein XENOCAPTIV_011960 [Xenoophorus captivus]|uniref:Uncharacterized protein n=1 Tax=Xenoophorus captivus TaxID=1517983 RepID=A0ABV0QHW2_9TELE